MRLRRIIPPLFGFQAAEYGASSGGRQMNETAALGDIAMACFIGTWIVLALGGSYILYLRRDAAFKRKWFPRYVIVVGVLFVLFSTMLIVLQARSPPVLVVLAVVVPIVVGIAYLNINVT